MRKKLFCILCIICVLIVNNVAIADEIGDEDFDEEELEEAIAASAEIKELEISSRNAVAYDRATGRVIWGKNENKRTAMASTTKILTAIVVIESGKNLNEIVEVSGKAAGIGGSRLGLKKGDKVSVMSLLYGLMLRSGNDAAIALAEYVGGSVEGFANLMNERAISLGLKDSHFVTPHGLDNVEHYTTAYELAKISDYALMNPTFSKIVATKSCSIQINNYTKALNNTNELLGVYPGVYGVKTGFTNNAGRCLVTAVKNDKFDIITVVLQADTKKARTQDSVKLINYVLNNYERANIQDMVDETFENWCEINLKRINIKRASEYNAHIEKEALKNKSIMVKKDEIRDINVNITGIFDYEAPVEKGTKFGEIRIYKGDELLEVDDIVFGEGVQKKTWKNYFRECLKEITYII